MKLFLQIFICLVTPVISFAQELKQPRLGVLLDSIDKNVHLTDSLIKLQKHAFTKTNNNSKKPVTEKWVYANSSGQLVYMQISYAIDSVYFEEDYYVTNNSLLVSEEKHIRYMPHIYGTKQSSHWMERCYFIKNKMIHETSNGHGVTETDNYDPEKTILVRFNKRLATLKAKKLD